MTVIRPSRSSAPLSGLEIAAGVGVAVGSAVAAALIGGGGEGPPPPPGSSSEPSSSSESSSHSSSSSSHPSSSSSSSSGPPPPFHLSDVVIIMEENEASSHVVGSPDAPYFNSILPHGALALPLNNCHPSEPNYLTITSGSNWGLSTDDPAFVVNARNIVDSLEAAGIPWTALMESMTNPLVDSGNYVQKHNPFIHYTNIRTDPTRMAKIKPYSDAFWSTWEGGYVFVSPNLVDDGHTPGGATGVKNADTWLQRVVPLVLASPPFQRAGSRAVLVISWDESEGSGGSGCVYPGYAPPFASFWIGPAAKAGVRSTATYQGHASELHTIEAGMGLPPLTANDTGAPVMSDLLT